MLINDALTLYHKTYDPRARLDVWVRTRYSAVNWYAKQAAAVGESGLVTADEITVRVFTDEAVAAAPGDIVALGLRDEAAPADLPPLAERFVVTAVRDNRRGSPALHHWRLEGK